MARFGFRNATTGAQISERLGIDDTVLSALAAAADPDLALQTLDRLVDVRPVGQDLVARGPGQEAALRPGMARAERLVVGVEEEIESLVEGAMVAQVGLQQHRLEEPGGVREVPLGGA